MGTTSRRPRYAPLPSNERIALNPRPWCDRRPHECQWPLSGWGERMLTCCNPAMPGSPYCEGHAKRAYVK